MFFQLWLIMSWSDTPVYANPENNLDNSFTGTNKQTVEIKWILRSTSIISFPPQFNVFSSSQPDFDVVDSLNFSSGETSWKPVELGPQVKSAVTSLLAALNGHRLQLDHIQVCVCFIHYRQRHTVFVTDCLCTICYLSSQWVTVAYFLCPALICWPFLFFLINGHLGYSAWRYTCFCMTNM